MPPGVPSGAHPVSLPPCFSFLPSGQPEQPSLSAATRVALGASPLWTRAATSLPGGPVLMDVPVSGASLVSGACWLHAFPGISDRGKPGSDQCSLDHFAQQWSWYGDRRPRLPELALCFSPTAPLWPGGPFQPCQTASRLVSDQSVAFNAEREESW